MLNTASISTVASLPALPENCSVVLVDVSEQVMSEAAAESLLSPRESERASMFRLPDRRHHYVQCHALLRVLLAGRVGVPVSDITYDIGEFDKPVLSGAAAESGVTFNISHSGQYALIAIGADVDIGVDIEQVKSGRNISGIAEQYFAATEQQAIRALPDAEQENAFYSCWCRKESFIKAQGLGLQMPLDCFVVNVDPAAAAELQRLDYQNQQLGQWQMFTLLMPPGYVGALTFGAGHVE